MSIDKFEKNIASLEKIVSSMEDSSLSLDKSVKSYETGVKLAKSCYDMLEEAQKRVSELEAETIVSET